MCSVWAQACCQHSMRGETLSSWSTTRSLQRRYRQVSCSAACWMLAEGSRLHRHVAQRHHSGVGHHIQVSNPSLVLASETKLFCKAPLQSMSLLQTSWKPQVAAVLVPHPSSGGFFVLLLQIATSPAGDIVVAKNMQSPRYVVCKRVLGLQGDQVIVRPSTGTELPYTTTVSLQHLNDLKLRQGNLPGLVASS